MKFNASCVDNVEVHGIGLGDKEGVFKLVENPTNLGGSSIKYGDTLKNRNVDIRVKRLDDLALDLSLLCFVKIDVEGFESNVLRGGIQTIKKSKPIIAFEQFESEFLDGTTESISLLSDIGYRFCWYRAGTLSKLWVIRRFYNIKELAMGRTHRMVTGQNVPKDTYSMLIAVPPQYHGILGLA